MDKIGEVKNTKIVAIKIKMVGEITFSSTQIFKTTNGIIPPVFIKIPINVQQYHDFCGNNFLVNVTRTRFGREAKTNI